MTELELGWLRAIRDGLGALKPLASFVTEFGDEMIIFVLIAFVYFAIDKDKGEKIAFIALSSSCVNGMLKSIVARPRPFTYDSSLASAKLIRQYTGTYSFPSGHAQNAGAVYASIMRQYPKPWVNVLCIAAMILIPFSRLMLGVHFPTDVTVGLAFGILCAFAFGYLVDRFWNKRDHLYSAISVGLLSVMIAACTPLANYFDLGADTVKAFGALTGLLMGCVVEHHWIGMENTRVLWKRIARVLFALAVLAALKFGLKPLFSLFGTHVVLDYLRYLITVAGAIAFCPWVIKKSGF